MSKKKLRRKIARLERRIAELERLYSNIPWADGSVGVWPASTNLTENDRRQGWVAVRMRAH